MKYTWLERRWRRIKWFFRFRKDGVNRAQAWRLARAVWP